MSLSGFKGISYPFRVSSQGGAVMTDTNEFDSSHIDDSIRQILGTYELERPMESDVFCRFDIQLFEPNDEVVNSLLKDLIIEDLNRLEDRIEVDEDSIEFEVDEVDGVSYLYVTISYTIIKFNTYTTTTFNLGEVMS